MLSTDSLIQLRSAIDEPRDKSIAKSWKEVATQGTRHSSRDGAGELYDIARPNEPDNVKDYRNANRRNITKEGFEKFLSKSVRIFKNSGIEVNDTSDILNEWLQTKPFSIHGSRADLWSYMYEVVLPTALRDPNGLWIAVPYTPDDPNVPPANAADPSERIGIESMLIPSELVVPFDDAVVWQGGEMTYKDLNGNDRVAPFYFVVTDTFYHLFIPVGQDKETGTIVYRLVDWYDHGANIPMSNRLPGAHTIDKDTDKEYNESLIHSYFEYSDEFVVKFSDHQAVFVQHAYPKTVIREMSCKKCEGVGKHKRVDENGAYVLGDRKVPIMDSCVDCGGTGVVTNIEMMGTLIRPKNESIEGADTSPLLEYISPDSAILDIVYDTPFDILKKAKQSIGLDVLENIQESGIAKEYRLEDLQDILSRIGEGLMESARRFLYQCEILLQPIESKRQFPNIKTPQSYAVKTPQMLLMEAKESVPADVVQSELEYYKVKYQDDPKMIRVYELAHSYSPLLALDDNSLKTRLAVGSYSNNDVVKRDYAVTVFKEIGKDTDLNTLSLTDAFKRADEILTAMGVLKPEPVEIFGSPDDETGQPQDGTGQVDDESVDGIAGRNDKLLESVGGVQGLIGISASVASGEMTEAAAENILMVVYGFDRATANSLIDVPDAPPQPDDTTE